MKRIGLFAFLCSLLAAPLAAADDLVVVELFNSQGCDMCPPANKLLAEVAEERNVLALSWQVDYWDYQGWKDTMAQSAYTARQEDYNAALGRRGVYTPQMIINGRRQVVGSNKLDLYQTIQSALIANELPMTVHIEASKEGLQVRVDGPKQNKGANIQLVWFNSLVKIKIGAGGNAGKTISYVNVVRDFKTLAVWQGKNLTVPIDLADPGRNGADHLAVLVQEKSGGAILGAARVSLENLPR